LHGSSRPAHVAPPPAHESWACDIPTPTYSGTVKDSTPSSLRKRLATFVKNAVRRILPLALRKRIAVWLGRQRFEGSYYWSMEIIRDLCERDPNAFHRFLWAHHLAYAETYEVGDRFAGALHPTRHLLVEEIERHLGEHDDARRRPVKRILDVGCSLGYLLRHFEQVVFPEAERYEGIDIDRYAIEQGSQYLRAQGSRVELRAADMGDLEALLADREFDLITCAGVLMYLKQEDAREVVGSMLRHGRLVVLTGLAHPGRDNRLLDQSAVRERDGTFIHNIDSLVESTGGRVVRRRYEGPRQIEGNTVYFVFAEPGSEADSRTPSLESA
jgi:SAM-dependent methyltransferase